MRLHWSVVIAFTALSLASCIKEDAGGAGRLPICFEAQASSLETKAANEMGLTQLRTNHFGVFASYTGGVRYEQTSVVPDFMYNQEVSWDNPNWIYSPIKYWPNAQEYVSFFAYAPYESNPSAAGACIFGFSPSDEMGDPWLCYRLADDPAQQVDLLYGTPLLDQERPASGSVNDKLTFQFNHALSCIGDNVSIKGTQELLDRLAAANATLTVNSISLNFSNLTAKGRLSLNSQGGPDWQPIVSGTVTTSRTVSKAFNRLLSTTPYMYFDYTSPSNPKDNKGLFYIPMNVPGYPVQQVRIRVDYTLTLTNTGTTSTGTTYSAPIALNGTPGTKMGLAITITEDLEVIAQITGLDATLPPAQGKEDI